MLKTLKLIVIGPVGAGKTTISNFIADATEMSSEYRPTQGVRILEFESQEILVKQRKIKIDIELWDCSGNEKFTNCWPVMRKDTHGVIFIYSGKTEDNVQELQKFYEHFVEQAKLGPKNCVVFHFNPQTDSTNVTNRTNPAFAQISQVSCNVENDGDKLKQDFHTYLKTLVNNLQENTDQQENSIMLTKEFK